MPAPGATEAAPGAPAPEVVQRLTALDAQYQAAVQRDVTQVQETALRDLNSKFLAALDRAMISASGSAQPQEIAVLNAEKSRVSQNLPLPPEDGPEVTAGLKELRRIYRTSLSQIQADAAKSQRNLAEKYDQVLAACQQELGQPGQEAGAAAVQRRREVLRGGIQEITPAAMTAEPAAATPPSPAATTSSSTMPALAGEEGRLQQALAGTTWRWRSQSDEFIDLLPDGRVYCRSWEEQNFGVTWRVLGRRQVLLKITGRENNTEATLNFSEDLASYTGTDFSGRPFRSDGSRIAVMQATQALLDREGPVVGKITFPAGEYRLKHQLVLGGPDPVDKSKTFGRLTSLPGARFMGGSAFVEKGSWNATGTLFNGIKITAEWGADFKAAGSLFSNSLLGKGGGWYGDYFSSKWTFDNCVFTGSFIQPWKIVDVGVKLTQSTFHEVDFPPVQFSRDAGDEVKRSWLVVQNCRFINCKIPESLLISTKDCVFEGCTFGPPEPEMRIKTPVKTIIYVTDRRTLPLTGPDRQIEVLDASRVPQPAGATLRYGKNGLTLNFQ